MAGEKTAKKKKNEAGADGGPAELEGAMVGADMETLRDILFGNQARATEERLSRLERELAAARQELSEQLKERFDDARQTAASQLEAAQTRLSQDAQASHDELAAAMQELGADLRESLARSDKEMHDRLDKLERDLTDRILTTGDESHQRDQDLRQELLTLSAWLDDKKASRHDLGRMLIEVGQELSQDGRQEAESEK